MGGEELMAVRERVRPEKRNIVDMSWDPVTRIVGNLGIYTKIDFDNREVIECRSTSSIFRGYSVFMRGKDPRDAGFITSRICGICGDNHTVCSNYAQNMAFGITNPPLAEIIINLGEAAEYMFDHTIFQDNLVFVDFCEQMVKETNPSLLAKAEQTEAPNAEKHGYRTIADIMRAFNPFEGDVYKEALQFSRVTREMFCLMEGRHVHPSTMYPGGVGTVPTPQVFTDYLVRLMRCLDFIKRGVPMNDDVFNFFYEALPGVLSHHLVIREGKIATYPPHPPTPWNASPRDFYGTPGPYEDAVQGQKIFEENDQESFRGIDIMRTVRSFDPCLPCGVHMYLGNGKTLKRVHSPTFGINGSS